MRFYLFILMLVSFLLIDLSYKTKEKQTYQMENPDTCEVNIIDRTELNGYIGQVFTDTFEREYRIEFNSYCPVIHSRKRCWAIKRRL